MEVVVWGSIGDNFIPLELVTGGVKSKREELQGKMTLYDENIPDIFQHIPTS